MMDTDIGKKALIDIELYNGIIEHRKNYSKLNWMGDYSGLGRDKISFLIPTAIVELYKKDYETMKEQMIYGEAPEFEDLVLRLNQLGERFTSTAKF